MEYSASLEFVARNLEKFRNIVHGPRYCQDFKKPEHTLTSPKAADRIPSSSITLSITDLYITTRPSSPLTAPFRVLTYLTGPPSIMATALAVGFGIATAAFLVCSSPHLLLSRIEILTMTFPSGSRWLSGPPKIPRRRQRHGPRLLQRRIRTSNE